MSAGRQHLGAIFNLVAYYVLALPMGITLAFHPLTHLGLQGLWIGPYCIVQGDAILLILDSPGQVVALFIVGLGEYGVVWLGTNWDLEVQRGIKRNELEAKRQARLLDQE
jgi:MATE family multidrug resistance protein